MKSWTRRDFGRALGVAVVPALAASTSFGADPVRAAARPGWPTLWPEAWKTIHFYGQHLPAHLQLARPTLESMPGLDSSTRNVSIPVLDGSRPVGQIRLTARFSTTEPTRCAWQGVIVAGTWYEATIRNAFQANAVA